MVGVKTSSWILAGLCALAPALAGCAVQGAAAPPAAGSRAAGSPAAGSRGAGSRAAGSRAAGAVSGAAAGAGSAPTLVTEPAAHPIQPFLRLIAGARHRVDLTMYDLADAQIERALAAAARRGVAVRVLLNGGYYSGRTSTNSAAFGYLSAHGVPVHYSAPYFAYTHQKTLTVDGRRTAIMTLNFTSRYYANTRDFAVIDARAKDVQAIERVFAADWRAQALTPSAGAGGLVWSPGATTALVRQIASARRSLDVESEELTDAPAIAAICAAARRGVDVRLVMTYDSEWLTAFGQLKSCGARIRVYHGEHPIYIHAKLIEADHRSVLIGSQNLTPTSLQRNRELGILTTSPAVVRGVSATFDNDFRGATPPP